MCFPVVELGIGNFINRFSCSSRLSFSVSSVGWQVAELGRKFLFNFKGY